MLTKGLKNPKICNSFHCNWLFSIDRFFLHQQQQEILTCSRLLDWFLKEETLNCGWYIIWMSVLDDLKTPGA